MKSLLVDKIASVTLGTGLGKEIRVGSTIPCEEGVLVAARVLNDKNNYNQIELTSGRLARVKKGDYVVGALGHRKALFGYSGHLPEQLAPGDTIQILNMGGAMGICDASHPDLGEPFDCEVVGSVLEFPILGERVGVPARAGQRRLNHAAQITNIDVPVIAIAGTCMNCGKTAAAEALIRHLAHNGVNVHAFKATGVSLRRDILAMEDAGAKRTAIFTDLGVITTTDKNGAALTRSLLAEMSAGAPDVIVFELGDGILGAYGVEAILSDPQVKTNLTGVVLAANDPVGAWGGIVLLREQFGIEPIAVTGPATDNEVGVGIIAERLGIAGLNARTQSKQLGELVLQCVTNARRRPEPSPS